MKVAFVGLAVIMSSLSLSAQTTTDTVTMTPTTIVLNVPCARNGKGDTITFKGNIRTVFHVHTDVNGIQDGFQDGVGIFIGRGLNHALYEAEGGSESRFTGLNRTTGDQTVEFEDSFHVRGPGSPIKGVLYHRTQGLTVSDGGNTISITPESVVCQ